SRSLLPAGRAPGGVAARPPHRPAALARGFRVSPRRPRSRGLAAAAWAETPPRAGVTGIAKARRRGATLARPETRPFGRRAGAPPHGLPIAAVALQPTDRPNAGNTTLPTHVGRYESGRRAALPCRARRRWRRVARGC